jgi:uncharacterized protein
MNAGRTSTAFVGAGMRLAVVCVALLCALVAAFALNFPLLSGRVVDQANIIPADTRSAITSKLADLEAKSGIQLVVATVTSLEGQEIEPYANELFRNWKLGEKIKNNGVLLLVAPNEHRVRIEVGYGLEGTLTDALSKVIIANAITPRFRLVVFVVIVLCMIFPGFRWFVLNVALQILLSSGSSSSSSSSGGGGFSGGGGSSGGGGASGSW